MKNLKKRIRKILRYNINKKNKKRLTNKNFTIISSNCIGGVIYHELGLQFLSPTINMFFSASDFVKFCKDINHYLNEELVLIEQTEFEYPIVKIDDITLHCVHYKNFNEVVYSWEKRKKRINFNNIFFIMSERDNCTIDDIKAFNKLPYNNKIIFVHKKMPEIKSSYCIPNTNINGKDGNWIIGLTEYKSPFTGERFIDDFDYVSFLNKSNDRM